ncbi:MAG TPA: alanine racemase [Acidimicrobiales bacterium]|nr:alanine racemase [Acidimicrobiales bacterium]
MAEAYSRLAWAAIDLEAVGHNVRVLSEVVAPAAVCAVVKADGYGHGAVPVARAALEAGARWLGVAVVEEGVELRDAGIEAPILLLSEPTASAIDWAVFHRITPVVYTPEGVEAAEAAAERHRRAVGVHLKVDTGMHRVGARPEDALALAKSVVAARNLRLEGLMTHLAAAEDPAHDEFTAGQVARFEEVRDELATEGIVPDLLHAANSAGAVAHPSARYDMVRCGIAVYGLAPGPALAGRVPLRPAMAVTARVSFVREVEAGEAVSYGLRYRCEKRTTIAVVPVGYADGIPRSLGAVGGEVLVGGRRCPIAGTVTMDQTLIDCGPGAPVYVGDEVVLLGRQGDEEITAEEWGEKLGTINYEVVTRIGPRLHRAYDLTSGSAVQAELGDL